MPKRLLIQVFCWGLILSGCAFDAQAPAGKQAIESAYASQMAAAPSGGPKDPAGARPSDDPAAEPWPGGIFDEREAPFPAAEYTIQNRWQDDFGGRHVVAYAGSLGDGSEVGVVVLQIFSMDLSQVSTRRFDPPTGHGPLRIIGVSGHVLTIRAGDGTIDYFDVDRAAFLP